MYRRLQRVFRHVDLGPSWSAPLVVWLLALSTARGPSDRVEGAALIILSGVAIVLRERALGLRK